MSGPECQAKKVATTQEKQIDLKYVNYVGWKQIFKITVPCKSFNEFWSISEESMKYHKWLHNFADIYLSANIC
jgi:hypothetical protein